MKKWGYIIAAAALAASLTGCSAAYFATAGYGSDDLYAVHDKAAIARRKQAEAEAEKAEAEARKAEWEARIAQAEADAAQQRYYASNSSSGSSSNRYEDIVADTYQSAYARRLKGFQSPTYRMPSSYYNFRYGSSFSYVSAYDPAFYNVIVMGDEVWVEPKYITSMFGSWGRPSVYVDPWYYGWNYRPYYNWGFSFGGWGWSFGSWYDPWYYPGWGFGWGYHGHPHWGAGPAHPHRPYASNIVHRADPYTSPSGGRYYRNDRLSGNLGSFGSNTGGTYRDRSNRNGSFGVRNSSSDNRQQNIGSTPSSSRGSGNNDRYNGSSGSRNRDNSGSNNYNRGNSGSNNYNRGSSSNNGSYNRGTSSGSWGGGAAGGSYSRGGASGGSSGGGARNAGGR